MLPFQILCFIVPCVTQQQPPVCSTDNPIKVVHCLLCQTESFPPSLGLAGAGNNTREPHISCIASKAFINRNESLLRHPNTGRTKEKVCQPFKPFSAFPPNNLCTKALWVVFALWKKINWTIEGFVNGEGIRQMEVKIDFCAARNCTRMKDK